MIYLTIGFFVIIVWHIISDILWKKERSALVDRLMAKNYQEFKYYESQYEDDLVALKKLRKDEFKKIEKEDSKPVDKDVKKFLSEMEEDWSEDSIDVEALEKQVINESEKDREDNSKR